MAYDSGRETQDVTGGRRLWSVVAVLSFGLAASGWILRTSALQAINQASAQADAIGAGLQRLIGSLATMAAAERGLALLGREADTQALASAVADVDRSMAAVSSLTSDLGPEGPGESLRMLVAEAVSTSRQTARLRKAEGAEAAMKRAVSDEDQVLREHVQRAALELSALARQQADKTQAAAGTKSLIALGMAIVGFAGLVAALFGLSSGSRPVQQDEYRSAVREERSAGEAMLPSILGTLDDAVLAIDAHGKVVASNAAANSLLGLGDSGAGSKALFAPDAGKKGPPAESPLHRALKGHSIQAATLSVGRPNEAGSRRVSVSAKPVLDPDGRTRGAVMILRDITDGKANPGASRKATEASPMRPPEEAFGKVFEDAPIAIALLGLDGRVSRANAALCRLLGSLPEELVGRDPGKLVHADDVKKEAPLLRQLMKGEIPSYEIDKRFTVKTRERGKETTLVVHWSASALRATSGEITGALAFVEEVKEKKSEGRLARETQDMLRLVLDTVPVGVWVTDNEGRVKLANPAGRRIWSKDEAVARFEQGEYKGWWADSGKRIEPDEWGALRAITTGEAQVDKAIQVQRFDGTRKTLLTSAVPLRAGDGSTSGAVVVQQEVPEPVPPGDAPAEPTDAKAQLEALAAIVPICPSCEKRREDPAYWKQVRAYVHEHRPELRGATCQECSSRAYDLWGELIDEKTVAGES
jgi:PAS domain S-box-containing protein